MNSCTPSSKSSVDLIYPPQSIPCQRPCGPGSTKLRYCWQCQRYWLSSSVLHSSVVVRRGDVRDGDQTGTQVVVQRQEGSVERDQTCVRCRQLPRPDSVRHFQLHRPEQLRRLRSVHARICRHSVQRPQSARSTRSISTLVLRPEFYHSVLSKLRSGQGVG